MEVGRANSPLKAESDHKRTLDKILISIFNELYTHLDTHLPHVPETRL